MDEQQLVREVAEQCLGGSIERLADLGEPRVMAGSLGRGGGVTVPVVEWILGGIIGVTAFEGARLLSRKARDLLEHFRRRDKRVNISRGMAALG